MPSHFIKRHKDAYEHVSEEEFDLVGMGMLRRPVGGSTVIHDRRFIATFGCLPRTCVELWAMILNSGNEDFMVEVHGNKKP